MNGNANGETKLPGNDKVFLEDFRVAFAVRDLLLFRPYSIFNIPSPSFDSTSKRQLETAPHSQT